MPTIPHPARPTPRAAEAQLERWRATPFDEPLHLNAPVTPELARCMHEESRKIMFPEIRPALRVVLQLGGDDEPPPRMMSAARTTLAGSGLYSIRHMVDADGVPSSELEEIMDHCRAACQSEEQRGLLTAERFLAALWQVQGGEGLATGAAKMSIAEQ